MGPAPDAELRLRAERAEQQVADLKGALANLKSERDKWRTMAERRSLPDQPAEGTLARREVAGLVVAADRIALDQDLPTLAAVSPGIHKRCSTIETNTTTIIATTTSLPCPMALSKNPGRGF